MKNHVPDATIGVLLRTFSDESPHFQNFVAQGIIGLIEHEFPLYEVEQILSMSNDNGDDVVVEVRGVLSTKQLDKIKSRVLFICRDTTDRIAAGSTTREGEAACWFRKALQNKVDSFVSWREEIEGAYHKMIVATVKLLDYGFGCSSETSASVQQAINESKTAIEKAARMFNHPGGLGFEDLEVALARIGYDLGCKQCASIFYTGAGEHDHNADCRTLLSVTSSIEHRK